MSHWAWAWTWTWTWASGRAGYSGELVFVKKDELIFEMQLWALGNLARMGHGCNALKGLTGTTIRWH